MEFGNFIEETKELPGVALVHGGVANLELYPKLLLYIGFEGKKFLLFAHLGKENKCVCLHIMWRIYNFFKSGGSLIRIILEETM